jgi:hypothetical protein
MSILGFLKTDSNSYQNTVFVSDKYIVHPISNPYGLKYEYRIKDAWASTLHQGIFLYLIGIKLKSAIRKEVL